MAPLLFVASATLLASFLCSLFEAVLYSITPTQLEVLKKRGELGAHRLARLRADVEEPIAAILTVNTIAHTVGAAWCGAMAGETFGSHAVGIFAAVFTFLVLAVTEIVPKSVGVRYAAPLGPRVAWPIQVMVWLAWPLARPAKIAMHLLTGPGLKDGPSEEEVMLFSRLAAKHGTVRKDEHRWVENALRLDRLTAGDLRTPRTVVEVFPAEATLAELRASLPDWVHSRVPVIREGDRDQVVGVVYRRDVVDEYLAGREEIRLEELMHPIQFVPESMPAHELLKLFLDERRHLFAVADEYGGFEGVVTLEDVLEALLGSHIVDEHDTAMDMQEVARRQSPLAGPEAQDA